MKQLVIYLLILMFSTSGFSSTWIIDEGAKLDDLHKIENTPILFVEKFIDTSSTIDALALDLARDYEQKGAMDVFNSFINEMQKVTLTDSGRNLISQTLDSQRNTKGTFVVQREHLFQGPESTNNFLPEIQHLSNGGALYINGFLIQQPEINRLRFKKGFFYHLALISNKFEPILVLAKSEDLRLPSPSPLFFGNCRDARFSPRAVSEGLKVLFSDNCVADSRLANFDPRYLNVNSDKASDVSKKTKYVIWGLASLVAGALAYNYFKTHEVTLELQF